MPEFVRRILRQPVTWVWLVALAYFSVFTISFRPQLLDFWASIGVSAGDFTTAMVVSRWILFYNALAFLVTFFLTMFIAAPVMLPIQNFQERWRTIFYLILQMFGAVGPVVFVHEGGSDATPDEKRRTGLGVLVIDFNSAVVLEEEIPAPTILSAFTFFVDDILLRVLRLMDPFESPRIRGAGIVFTRRHERIRAIVDLRRQTSSKVGVSAYTRDGIEVTTICWALFSLGLDPNKSNVLEVSYLGEERAENLRVIEFKEAGKQMQVMKVTNSLHINDREAIHKHLQDSENRQSLDNPFEPLPSEPPVEPNFNPQRVFNAVFTEARDAQEILVPWQRMPLVNCIEAFRSTLLQWNYDDLICSGHTIPYDRLRQQINQAVVNAGMRSFRYVHLASGEMISTYKKINKTDLLASDVRPVQAKPEPPLRTRGITVIAAGYTEIEPPESIHRQRLDNWRASLDSDTKIESATLDLEASRIRNQAYLRTQEDIITTLNNVFQDNSLSREALAINIVQVLEAATADPQTRQLIPDDVVTLMRDIHSWLIPTDQVIYPPPR